MERLHLNRRRVLKGLGALPFAAGALSLTQPAAAHEDGRVRWDIVNVDLEARVGSEGGQASAFAQDGSSITLSGSGRFRPEEPGTVTGGGRWVTRDPDGKETDRGTYDVVELVLWTRAPGEFPEGFRDKIGDRDKASAGLALLHIAYSDRSRGVLTVSCHLEGTPDSVFEGITATKDFVTYWRRAEPGELGNLNATLFHVRSAD